MSSGSPCSPTGSASGRSSPGRGPGVGAVATPYFIAEPAYGPRLLDALAAGASPDGRAGARAARGRRAGRLPADRGRRRPRPRERSHTGGPLHRLRRRSGRPRLQRAGEHDGRARRLAGDGPGLRGGRRGRSRGGCSAALHAAEAQGGDARGRQSAALLVVPPAGEAWRHERRAAHRGRPRAARRSRPSARPPRRLRAGQRGRRGSRVRAATTRPARSTPRASALAPDNHELLFWAGLAAAQAGDLPAGASSGCAGRSSCSPAGRRAARPARAGHRPGGSAGTRGARPVAPEATGRAFVPRGGKNPRPVATALQGLSGDVLGS